MTRTRLMAFVFAMFLTLSIASVAGAQSGGEGENGNEALGENYFCVNRGEQHPIGARLADNYDVPYDVVMDWFCGGFGFGQLKMALQISAATGEPPDALLERKSGGMGWGEIRKELGLNGPPGRGGDDRPGNGDGKPFKHHGRPPWAGRPGGPWGGGPLFSSEP